MMIISSNFCIMSRILVKFDIYEEFNLCTHYSIHAAVLYIKKVIKISIFKFNYAFELHILAMHIH